MTHAAVILNPAANRGAARRLRDPVARAFRARGWTVDVVVTERPGHAAELARAIAGEGMPRLVAVGGDGVVHEVANGILAAGAGTVLGVVPAGSGNDFAKLAGVYGHTLDRAVERLVGARTEAFDVGEVLGEYFVNSLGFGFGPAVVRMRNAMPRLRGFLSYLVPILRTFASFTPPRFTLTAADRRESGPIMMLEVCNGTTAGGSYRFAPAADPRDGLLDACLVRRVSLPRFLQALPRVMRGTHGTMREVALFRVAELGVRCESGPLVLHLDGELREPGVTECVVRAVAGRLNVLVAS